MNTVIAKSSLFGQRRGEKCFRITVEIGTPYRNGFGPGEWACPVAVHPLFSRLQEAHGEDSFQSLCLAISLAQSLLADFRDDGGSLIHVNGDAFPLESYAFGIATRASSLLRQRPPRHARGPNEPGTVCHPLNSGVGDPAQGGELDVISLS